jgi:hypothetical protein
MAANNADYAVALPNVFQPLGQVMQQGLQQSMANTQLLGNLYQRREKQAQARQERDDVRKAAALERNSDPLKYYTGVQMFDSWADKKTNEILDQFTNDPKYRNMDLATFTGELNKAWLPIVQGHKLIKGKLGQELESVNQITSQNKWLDKDLLTRGVYNSVAQEYFQPNESGEITFKPIDKADYSKPLAESLISGDNAINYISNQAVDEFMKTFGKLPSESESFLLRTPEGGTAVYKGTRSPFQVFKGQKDQYGFVKGTPAYDIINDGRTDEMGNPVMTIPNELMETFITNTTGNKMVYEKLFREYAQDKGIDLGKLSPSQAELERSKFNYTLVKNSPLTQPDLFQYQRPPQGSTFNINTNQQQFDPNTTGIVFDRIGEDQPYKTKSGITIQNGIVTDAEGNLYTTGTNEIYVPKSAIPSTTAQIVNSYLPDAKLRAIVQGYNIKTENGKIVAVKPATGVGKELESNWITRQDAYNAQLKANTESVKGAQPAFGNVQGAKPPQPKTSKYNINGKTYTSNDLIKLGYTQEQINQAIKLGTIKPE